LFSCKLFTAKHQLNQCIKNNIAVRCLVAAHLNCDGKLLNVTDLSVWESCISCDFKSIFSSIKNNQNIRVEK